MTDYTKLVKALRYCAESGDFKCGKDCPMHTEYPNCLTKMDTDAAAAIEELQATIELMKPFMPDFFPDANNVVLPKLEPKRGKMYFLEYDNPETGEYEQTYFQCSVCGKYFYGIDECEAKHFNYCPNCGAKMEVQIIKSVTMREGDTDTDGFFRKAVEAVTEV